MLLWLLNVTTVVAVWEEEVWMCCRAWVEAAACCWCVERGGWLNCSVLRQLLFGEKVAVVATDRQGEKKRALLLRVVAREEDDTW